MCSPMPGFMNKKNYISITIQAITKTGRTNRVCTAVGIFPGRIRALC